MSDAALDFSPVEPMRIAALYDIEPRRTAYDLEAAAARIRESGHPQAHELAVRNVLRPPSEVEMLDLF